MANPACTFGECGQSATFTGTFFDSGLSVIVCGDHFVEFAAGTLEAMTGIPVTLLISLPPEAFAEVVDHELGQIVAPPTSPGESSEVGTASDQTDEQRERSEFYLAHVDEIQERVGEGESFDEAFDNVL